MTQDEAPKAIESENDVWNAIAAFETILEALPEDRSSLETLSHAYEFIGDRAKALEYVLRLSALVVKQGDYESAGHMRDKLAEYDSDDERIAPMLEQLQGLVENRNTVADVGGLAGEVDADAQGDVRGGVAVTRELSKEDLEERSVFHVADELGFAWKLFEAGEISQDDYSAIAHDLAELTIDPHLSTVSVLHVLESRAHSGIERIIGYASRETKTPIVALRSFEVSPEVGAMLPVEFAIRRGALVFDKIQEEVLVAIMNPYDHKVREDVEYVSGHKCHFFMTLPSEFDGVAASLKHP